MKGDFLGLSLQQLPQFLSTAQGTGESLTEGGRGLRGGEGLVGAKGARSGPGPGTLPASSALPLFRRCRRHLASLILKEALCLTGSTAASRGVKAAQHSWGLGWLAVEGGSKLSSRFSWGTGPWEPR